MMKDVDNEPNSKHDGVTNCKTQHGCDMPLWFVNARSMEQHRINCTSMQACKREDELQEHLCQRLKPLDSRMHWTSSDTMRPIQTDSRDFMRFHENESYFDIF